MSASKRTSLSPDTARHNSRRRSHSPEQQHRQEKRHDREHDDGDRSRRRSRSPSPARKRSRSRSSDSQSDSNSDRSSESESDNSEEEKHQRKKAKHEKKEKDKKKKDKKDKKKKDKKEKKKKEKKSKRKDKETEGASGGVTGKWGSFGVLRESDMYRKQDEFQQWLMDVKKISPDSIGGNEEKQIFREYIEDFNTATLPHEKYYDMAAWQKKEDDKEAKRKAKRAQGRVAETVVNVKDDEEKLRLERQHRGELARQNPRFSTDQLLELRRLEHERVQVDRERKLGVKTKSSTGVRFEERML